MKILASFKKIFKNNTKAIELPTIIQPVYFITSLFGLFPTSIKYCKNKKYYAPLKGSVYVNSLCGVSFILLITTFLTLHIQHVFATSDAASMTESLMTQLNYILELITLFVFCLTAYISSYQNRNVYVKMLNTVVSTWMDLPNLECSQKILKQTRFYVNVVPIFILLTVFVLQICVNFTRDDTMWKIILVTITFNLPHMIQFVYLAFYYSLVMLVISLLSNINEQCHQLIDDHLVLVQSKTMCSTIRRMELVYIKAFEIKTQINKTFQGPILATTLQCFHSLVSESHIIYHGAVSRSATTHDLTNCSVWILYQVFKIYSLAYSGNLLKIKTLNIGQTLHSIPTEKQDVRCLAEIQHFATLMNYQAIEITLYGYFPVDATLVFNMMASAMMYLIILVQFDKKV